MGMVTVGWFTKILKFSKTGICPEIHRPAPPCIKSSELGGIAEGCDSTLIRRRDSGQELQQEDNNRGIWCRSEEHLGKNTSNKEDGRKRLELTLLAVSRENERVTRELSKSTRPSYWRANLGYSVELGATHMGTVAGERKVAADPEKYIYLYPGARGAAIKTLQAAAEMELEVLTRAPVEVLSGPEIHIPKDNVGVICYAHVEPELYQLKMQHNAKLFASSKAVQWLNGSVGEARG
ncbi:hypothetical protein C8R43DRAFT_951635 [Mycena crocata]|nr:hypothetical protein C8R43DRAFT_951635 [Mycena crocata]